ncbi:response regulator [Natronorubrum sp. JWXQ-INN-674]|uniref:histidine kinase n=1 Tax=Natronorubrum halalkaliphilum TaxID=2691917 RepID=A0A6B0VIR5_9EURY|nr:ATP-binding protein [Natronorubrum halalkaliphilum]MXV60987.1 response regulator [Natronorubrum halalkaliphilum]
MNDSTDECISLLLVDDDSAFLDLATTFLARVDDRFSIRSTTDPCEAVAIVRDAEIDCLISDYDMPGTNGLELLDIVREARPNLPFILVTGTGEEALASEAIRAGATDYLQKDHGSDYYTVLANRIETAVEKRRAERCARECELATSAASDAFFRLGVSSETLTLRSGFEQFGYTVDTTDLDWWFERVHPDERAGLREAYAAVKAREEWAFDDLEDDRGRFSGTVRWRCADDSFVTCQLRGIAVYGNPEPRIVGTMTDITERKEHERALTALNDVAVDLGTYDTVEGICERSIEASQAILQFDLSVIDIEEEGYLSKAAISEDLPEMYTIAMPVEEGIAGKTYRTGESLLIDDIDTHPEANPKGPYRSALSIPIGSHGVFQAVSEDPNAFDDTDLDLAELLVSHTASALDRLEREQQLRHQNERLEEFTRIISHDLRNPLNVVDGYLELAREEYDSSELDEAAATLSRMEAILEDTLTLARSGRVVAEMQSVALDDIAGDCWQNVATASATLEVSTTTEIRADPGRLRHVFENLFQNAIDHGGSDVTVRVGDFDGGFYVEDDGAGIPEDRREDVFESGYTDADGSGFGLAIVRRILEAHGWDVHVTDGTDGGARFEVFVSDGSN